jgi:uncharacterized membrane protein
MASVHPVGSGTVAVGSGCSELVAKFWVISPTLGYEEMVRRLRTTQARAWFIPLAYAAAALTFGITSTRMSHVLVPGFVSTISANAAIGIYSSIASGMIALTGIVFSLTFVMVQFSATAYSPRLVLWIARDPVISHAIGVFTATFLYALVALAWVDRGGSGRVPLVNIGLVTVLLIASVMMFISLIHRVSLLQVTRMLAFTGNQGRKVIENLYPPLEIPACPKSAEICGTSNLVTLLHRVHPQIVQTVDVRALVRIARQADCAIKLTVAVGDVVQDSTPLLQILGANGALPEMELRNAIHLGSERTFEQDPKYAIRLLVDIAIKALSQAINDPTTAVQALDQIEDLLLRLGRRRLEIGAFLDSDGKHRVLIAFPSWEDFLRLAFDEIRMYGANSMQVMRRMKALLGEMLSILPEERHQALKHWQRRLQSTVDRSFEDTEDKLDASVEDRQGLGISPLNK